MRAHTILALGILSASASFSSLALAAPRIGDVAPALDLPAVLPQGEKALVPLLRGKVTIVDFATTWCGPCHRALADLKALASELGPDAMQLIIVDVQEPAETVRSFFVAENLPADAKVVLDFDGVVAKKWGRDRFPTTFVVDQKGLIRFINRGCGPGYAARISDRVKALLPVAGQRPSD